MGNYSARDFMDLFGGLPERGDCAPDPDALREHGPHHLGASMPETPAGVGRVPPAAAPAGIPSRRRTEMACDNCGASEDQTCQPWCLGEQYS